MILDFRFGFSIDESEIGNQKSKIIRAASPTAARLAPSDTPRRKSCPLPFASVSGAARRAPCRENSRPYPWSPRSRGLNCCVSRGAFLKSISLYPSLSLAFPVSEKPTRWTVISSVAAAGVRRSSIVTLNRAKISHCWVPWATRKMRKPFSTSVPGGSLQQASISRRPFPPGAMMTGGAKTFSFERNRRCGSRAVKISSAASPTLSMLQFVRHRCCAPALLASSIFTCARGSTTPRINRATRARPSKWRCRSAARRRYDAGKAPSAAAAGACRARRDRSAKT